MNIEPKIILAIVGLVLTMFATPASALIKTEASADSIVIEPETPPMVIAQNGCMSLSQAVDSVRRRGDVEQVVSAETQVRGGREVHVIKVLTRDGRVTTHRIPGCPVN